MPVGQQRHEAGQGGGGGGGSGGVQRFGGGEADVGVFAAQGAGQGADAIGVRPDPAQHPGHERLAGVAGAVIQFVDQQRHHPGTEREQVEADCQTAVRLLSRADRAGQRGRLLTARPVGVDGRQRFGGGLADGGVGIDRGPDQVRDRRPCGGPPEGLGGDPAVVGVAGAQLLDPAEVGRGGRVRAGVRAGLAGILPPPAADDDVVVRPAIEGAAAPGLTEPCPRIAAT